jgi:hypothetical protein
MRLAPQGSNQRILPSQVRPHSSKHSDTPYPLMNVVPSSSPINGTNRLLHNRSSAFPTQTLVLRQTSGKYGLLSPIVVCIRSSVPLACSFRADVGGGSVRNFTRHSLARVPLRWMVREIFKANPGILFLRPTNQNRFGSIYCVPKGPQTSARAAPCW